MGKLVEGVWHDVWYQTENTTVVTSDRTLCFETGSPRMAPLALQVKVAIKQKPDDITYTYLWPVPGHIEQSLCGS